MYIYIYVYMQIRSKIIQFSQLVNLMQWIQSEPLTRSTAWPTGDLGPISNPQGRGFLNPTCRDQRFMFFLESAERDKDPGTSLLEQWFLLRQWKVARRFQIQIYMKSLKKKKKSNVTLPEWARWILIHRCLMVFVAWPPYPALTRDWAMFENYQWAFHHWLIHHRRSSSMEVREMYIKVLDSSFPFTFFYTKYHEQ